MGRQRHTAEQIISKLREAEVLQAKGMSMACSNCQSKVVNNKLANLCSPKGILLHPENSCIVIDLELD
jgi:hypothetical protein